MTTDRWIASGDLRMRHPVSNPYCLKHRLSLAPMALALAATAIACAATVSPAQADEKYPTQPIQMIVPFAAGGGFDATARSFAQSLATVLKQPVVVTNRDGATGTIGLQSVARAAPDGYTVVYTPAVSLTSEPHRNKAVKYDIDSFTPVCQVFDNIFSIVVTKDSPYRTLADLLADAKAHPGKISYGSSGIGSIPHLGTSDIETAAKVQLTHVPYRGDGPMLQDVMTGRLGFGALLASSVGPQVQAGSLRLLAVYSDQRHPGYPEVPTLGESGVPVVQLSFGGLLVPAKTPPAVVATLQSACQVAAQAPAFTQWAAGVNQVLSYKDGPAFGARLRQDSAAKEATLKRLNLAE